MGRRAPARKSWKAGGLIGCAAIVLIAGVSISAITLSDTSGLRAEYRRPDAVPYPQSNPYSAEKARLGKMLFFDPILSGSNARSCATCHNPALSWSDGHARSLGEKQQPLGVRAPTVLNVAFVPKLGWDGHFRDLEGVAFGPLLSPGNMNTTEKDLIARLGAIPGYVEAFDAAFGEGNITRRKIELALATFQRTIVSGEAPFDRWIAGDESAISDGAKRGFELFNGKAHCASCHSGWAFTDSSFHDIGSAQGNDIGRGKLFPTSVKLRHAFKTPTLRDVARRAPYMHDGSLPTLAAVIDLYDRGGIARPSRSELIRPLGLSKAEKADLVAFLRTLDSTPEAFALPTLPR